MLLAEGQVPYAAVPWQREIVNFHVSTVKPSIHIMSPFAQWFARQPMSVEPRERATALYHMTLIAARMLPKKWPELARSPSLTLVVTGTTHLPHQPPPHLLLFSCNFNIVFLPTLHSFCSAFY